MTYKKFKKIVNNINKVSQFQIEYSKEEVKALTKEERKEYLDKVLDTLLEAVIEIKPDSSTNESTTDTLLNERGKRYGSFVNQANLSQQLKVLFDNHVVLHGQPELFTHEMSEAIEMIFHKLARIANGLPNYRDSWDDIAGYAQLVSKTLDN